MTWEATVTIPGEPASQGSKRIGRNPKTGKPLLLDADDRLKLWRGELTDRMQRHAPASPIDGPVRVSIVIQQPRPRDHYRTNGELKPWATGIYAHSGKDADKVARACLDAGTAAGWWRDDRRVADLHITRFWTEGPASTLVHAQSLEVQP